MTPSQLLRKAADLLEIQGWVQNYYRTPLGHCAIGAISCAADGDPVLNIIDAHGGRVGPEADVIVAACSLLQEALGDYHGSIAKWNDARGRTKAQVIAMMIKAAEIGEPEKRRVLIPVETPGLTPDSPLWTDPAPEEPKRERVPA